MNKAHENINWQDLPIRNTPLAARNLNKMDHSIDVIDDRVIALDEGKVGSVEVTNTSQTGDTIATITVDGTPTAIKAKQPNESEMNVRSAMLLLSPTPIGENAPFVKRRSGGNVPFPALLKDKIIGASVVWNQLVKNGNFASTDNWTSGGASLSISNNIARVTFTGNPWNNDIKQSINIISGHKYLVSVGTLLSSGLASNLYLNDYLNNTNLLTIPRSTTSRTQFQGVFEASQNGSVLRITYGSNGSSLSGEYFEVSNFYITDLTAMFGNTIADYVNTLETQTAGSGIAWLKSYGFFTEDYYAYSANTIQSVSVSAKVNKDSEDTTISTVALDHTTLRGLFKLDANNNLYADGDIYPSDGTESVKYAEVDLGSLNWNYVSGYFRTTSLASVIKKSYNNNTIGACISQLYVTDTANNVVAMTKDKTISVASNGNINVYDSAYSDAETFTTAMSGKKLVYELATPTTASLTHYPDLQNIASGGTEEFIDYQVSQGNRDVSIPVGGDRQYYQGMDLPALPTASGNHNLQFNPSSGFSWS